MLGTWRRSSFRTWTPVRCSSFIVTAGSPGRRTTLISQGSFQSPTKTKPHLKVSLHAKDTEGVLCQPTPPYISQTQKVSTSPNDLFKTRILSILPYQGVKGILVPQSIYSKWNNGDILLLVLVWQWCCLLYDFNMTIMTSCLWFWWWWWCLFYSVTMMILFIFLVTIVAWWVWCLPHWWRLVYGSSSPVWGGGHHRKSLGRRDRCRLIRYYIWR